MRPFVPAVAGALLAIILLLPVGPTSLSTAGAIAGPRAFGAAPTAPPPPTYPVNGTVTDSLTGEPIVGATVRASSGPMTMTTANGSYVLVVQSGPETFTYSHTGYHGRSVNLPVVSPRIEDVALNPYVWILSGSVLDLATSTPIIGARVNADPGGLSTTTGASGQFHLTLENGTYQVNASASGFLNGSVTIVMNGSPLSKFVLLPPAGSGGGGGSDPTALLAIGLGVAAGVVGLGYLILASSGYRIRFRRRPGPLAGIPGERDPNLPLPQRSNDPRRYPPRRRT
ncbi:MAG: carboxypeptidase-like regulatory domain-containing protein [Thermoplasmata archaeon]|nr:carboxypeptidase-like regulatory domain-containing protein [Thermoplasmata archaeon]